MRVHLVDGTYELFRHFYGAPPHAATDGKEVGAARGVLASVLMLLADGATHVGVATDHVIESFRNDLWPGYKTGEGVDPLLRASSISSRTRSSPSGWSSGRWSSSKPTTPWPRRPRWQPRTRLSEQVVICTPDKDLGQCVTGDRVVQLDRRQSTIIDEDGVIAKFGVAPGSIPDFLALVGDSADGFPGLSGWGKVSAASVLAHYGHLEAIPDDVAAGTRQSASGCAERLGWPPAWPANATWPCSSATWPRCGSTDRCSMAPRIFAGTARHPGSATSAPISATPTSCDGRPPWPSGAESRDDRPPGPGARWRRALG